MKTEEKIAEFREFKKPCESFYYLGIELLVTNYEIYENNIVCLNADYVDKFGIIQSIKFSHDELPVLINENKKGKNQ